MRPPCHRTLLVLGLFALSACSSPMADEGCTKFGFECQDTSTALECVAGTWVSLPCRGPQGCSLNGSTVDCDMSANQEGDNCATTQEGNGVCASDGSAVLECRDFKLVKTKDCSTCEIEAGKLFCNP